MTATGKPLVHARVTPIADDAQAILPIVREFPFTFADANASNVVAFPIEPGTLIKSVILKIETSFDAANVDVGDSADADGFIVDGACTAGTLISNADGRTLDAGGVGVYTMAVLPAYTALGGKLYTAANMLKLTFADAVTAGVGKLYVEMISLS